MPDITVNRFLKPELPNIRIAYHICTSTILSTIIITVADFFILTFSRNIALTFSVTKIRILKPEMNEATLLVFWDVRQHREAVKGLFNFHLGAVHKLR